MKEVFEYIYGKDYRLLGLSVDEKGKYIKDGNDMVLAINAMQEKGDWDTFYWYCIAVVWISVKESKGKTMNESASSLWLFGNPANFFELMEKWLKEKVIG